MSLHRTQRPRRSSVASAEIENVLDSRGVAPLAEKALTVNEQIGKGRFKKVYKGELKHQCGGPPLDVVILQYKKQESEVNELSLIALLAASAHSSRFVPEVFGAVDQRTVMSVVQERAVFGTLKSALQTQDLFSQITTLHKLNAAMNVGFALDFLQSMRIVHSDLACRNVLLFRLEEDPSLISVKITDFGLALVVEANARTAVKKQPQATRWCSPETVAFNQYSFQSDMWSFGVCMWELFADGATPWTRLEKRADVTAMLTELSQHPDTTPSLPAVSVDFPFPDSCPWEAYEVILSCLRVDGQARPTSSGAANSFQGLVYNELKHAAEMLHSDEMWSDSKDELSNASHGCLDATGSVSTDASGTLEQPVSMNLVRHLSNKILENANDSSMNEPDHREDRAARQSAAQLKVVRDFLWSPYAISVLGDSTVRMMQQEVMQAIAQPPPKQNSSVAPPDGKAPLRDMLLPPVQTQGPARCWASAPPLSIWTLWTLAENDMLRRQDFSSRSAAQIAFQTGHGVLQSPRRDEVYTTYMRPAC